jgi:threonyl-tRNA synthetase
MGPHVANTSKIGAFKIMKNSSAYWLGNKENDSLQRIYGIAYPSKKELSKYLKFIEEAKENDHRVICK